VQNFLLVGPYFQRTIFPPQWPLLIALIVWGCGLLKIFGDWKYASPHFGPCLLWPNSWMDQDTAWYWDKPPPRRHCVRWGTRSSHANGHSSIPPLCGPLLWPASPQARILPIIRIFN